MLGLRTAHTVEKTQLPTEECLVQLQAACGRGVSCPPPWNFHLDSGWFVGCQVALGVKNSPANAGDSRDMGLIPGLGRSPGCTATLSSVLAWKIPWTEEPGRLHTVHRVTQNQTQAK